MSPEALWALIGAGIGGTGGLALGKYLDPDENLKAVLMGLGGAGVGGGLGYGLGNVKRRWDAIPDRADLAKKIREASSRAEDLERKVHESAIRRLNIAGLGRDIFGRDRPFD
jgi:hypothetical protein